MFKFLESPLLKSPTTPNNSDGFSTRPHNYRYSSVDQFYSKPDSSLSSSRLDHSRNEKKYSTGDKTDRDNKQRAHSQKKLTLTSAQPVNGFYIGSLGQSQNQSLTNARQAYEGFKKNLQLKTSLSKNTPLQKKGKLTATSKNTQQIKFPSSNSQIKIQTTQISGQKQNDYDFQTSSIQVQREKTKALIQANSNNHYASNPQYYCIQEVFQTAPSSPVYRNQTKVVCLETNCNKDSKSNQGMMAMFGEKLAQMKEQINAILAQNSFKIKELQGILLQNKQQLEAKDHKIRELQLSLVLKQNSTSTPFVNTSFLTSTKTNDFVISKINDLDKKVEVLSKWSNEQQEKLNSKLDQVNRFMDQFVAVKFHNLKFTLKAFATKNQQRINLINENVARIDSIVQMNQLESYEDIIIKAKTFAHAIQKLSEIKCHQKVHLEDMKTTINTAVDSFKHKPSYSTYQNMIDSTQINESFWNNLEDVSVQERMQQESSFTDDSFSYATGIKAFQMSPNSIPSVNQFALGSFPSFSKFSGEVNFCKESLSSIKSSMVEPESMCIKTLQEIAKCRQGPVLVYLDKSGSLRYKGSESYIFDRKGNILKPSREEVAFCMQRKWISMV